MFIRITIYMEGVVWKGKNNIYIYIYIYIYE